MHVVGERYALVQPLGEGASGEAWVARHVQTGRTVVVKLLHKKHADSPTQFERFRREVLALSKLRSPHVVELLDWGRCERRGQPFFVMAHAPGVPLGQILRAEKRLEAQRALRLVDHLLQALELAHAQGILHRDLKPDNLLVERPGSAAEHLRVLDFGLAKHLEGGEQTRAQLTEAIVGTPLYLAPEQVSGRPVSPATDIYAVGCILMQLLSGRPPFEGRVLEVLTQHVKEPAPRLRDLGPEHPQPLEAAVARCMAKDPRARPSASQLRWALSELAPAPASDGVRGTVDLSEIPAASVGSESATVDASDVRATRYFDEVLPALTLQRDARTTLEFDQVLPAPRAREAPTVPARATADVRATLDFDEVLTAPSPGREAAMRVRFDVEPGGGHVVVFGGGRLRFGQGSGQLDLRVSARLRPGESPGEGAARARTLAGQEATITLQGRSATLTDLGSVQGTFLDGVRLPSRSARRLPSAFVLRLGESLALAGAVVSDGAGRATAVRLRQAHDSRGPMYVLLDGAATLGASAADAIPLWLPGVLAGHAVLVHSGTRLEIAPAGGSLTIDGRSVGPRERVQVRPGMRVMLGATTLRFSRAGDEDAVVS